MAKHRKASRRIHEASLSTALVKVNSVSCYPLVHAPCLIFLLQTRSFLYVVKQERTYWPQRNRFAYQACKGKAKAKIYVNICVFTGWNVETLYNTCSIFNEKLKHELRNNVRIFFLLKRFQSRRRDYFAAHDESLEKLCYRRYWK